MRVKGKPVKPGYRIPGMQKKTLKQCFRGRAWHDFCVLVGKNVIQVVGQIADAVFVIVDRGDHVP